jgi:ABC-2 type transport system permease protein
MLAETVPAVQALGQAIFLPMIMIGGVGVPLWTLPVWAQHVAGFLPGKYAVQVLQQCASGEGLGPVRFDSAALIVIGGAAGVAGAKMFRWDAHEKVEPRQRRWVIVALLAWLSVGAAAEWAHRPVGMTDEAGSQLSVPDRAPYESITEQQINGIRYNDLEPDDSLTTPVAANLDGLDQAGKQRISELRRQLDGWAPAKDKSAIKRVRNLLSVAAIADLVPDRYEGAIAYIVFDKLKTDVPRDDLKKILTWIVVSPDDKQVIVTVPELGIVGNATAADVNERVKMYARKLLGRLVGKLPMAE